MHGMHAAFQLWKVKEKHADWLQMRNSSWSGVRSSVGLAAAASLIRSCRSRSLLEYSIAVKAKMNFIPQWFLTFLVTHMQPHSNAVPAIPLSTLACWFVSARMKQVEGIPA